MSRLLRYSGILHNTGTAHVSGCSLRRANALAVGGSHAARYSEWCARYL